MTTFEFKLFLSTYLALFESAFFLFLSKPDWQKNEKYAAIRNEFKIKLLRQFTISQQKAQLKEKNLLKIFS
jgi:hypothetical protein